jgi:four helix bundle protein
MQVHEMALSIVENIAPMMPLIQRQDRALAVQLRTAASSMVLNIAEAEYSDPGNKRARLFTAAGSTNESRSAVRVAFAWPSRGDTSDQNEPLICSRDSTA